VQKFIGPFDDDDEAFDDDDDEAFEYDTGLYENFPVLEQMVEKLFMEARRRLSRIGI
jgi:hypothetical protein